MVVALVILLLGAVVVLVGRSMWQQKKQDLAQKALELVPGVSQHIQDFRRVKVHEGRKVWEVAAQDAQYFEEDKAVIVRDAVVQWFMKDGRILGLSGAEGRITLEDREVTHVELHGDISVTLADYVVHTDRATYDRQRDLISAPGQVDLSGHNLHVRGEGMELEVEAQRVKLLDRVSTDIQPQRPTQGGGDAPR